MQLNDQPAMRDEVKQPYFYQGSKWQWGFTPSAEIWNGRLAMIGFLAATFVELVTGNGYLRFLGLLTGNDIAP
jgi:hypothetical protein